MGKGDDVTGKARIRRRARCGPDDRREQGRHQSKRPRRGGRLLKGNQPGRQGQAAPCQTDPEPLARSRQAAGHGSARAADL